MKARRLLLSLLCALLLGAVALNLLSAYASGVFYVAPAGNDANGCMTMSSACRTIPAAVGKATAGDTIIIAAGTYTEDIDISKDLTLIGFGADETLIDQGRIHVAGANVNIYDLAITRGYAYWGALRSEYSIVRLGYTSILSAYACYGGGIYNSHGTLIVDHSLIAGNRVVLNGAGIANYEGSVSISHSTIMSNTACNRRCAPDTSYCVPDGIQFHSEGGAIYNFVGGVDIDSSALIANSSDSGSDGIMNIGTRPMFITNTTFAQNGGNGSAIRTMSDVYLTNVTLSRNSIEWAGYNPRTYLLNTILGPIDSGRSNCSGPGFISLGHNLSSDASCNLTATGDLTNTDPLLGPLQDNGGPTWTHALLPGSPAINGGANTGCPPTDQRGITRPQAGLCDIGAYEFEFAYEFMLPLIRR